MLKLVEKLVTVVWLVSRCVANVVVKDVCVVAEVSKVVVRLVWNIASQTVTGVWLALLAMT